MALVHGNFPFGDAEITFGEVGGTFGKLWVDADVKNDAIISGGGEVTAGGAKYLEEFDIVISGGGDVTALLAQVFRYASSPTKVQPIRAVGPTNADLREAYAT